MSRFYTPASSAVPPLPARVEVRGLGAVATRITSTSGASDPELDARFEAALERARAESQTVAG